MKRAARSMRAAADVSESIHHRLNMYALAASAAGVGVLALAQPVEARIVFTHPNKTLGYGILNLDLNHDGKRDFAFCVSFFSDTSNTYKHPYSCPSARRRVGKRLAGTLPPEAVGSALSIFPSKAHKTQNQILGNSSGAYALPAGVVVGPKQKFTADARDMATWVSSHGTVYAFGPWEDAQDRYLALRFIINGQVHYGWARLTVTSLDRVHATLTGYAYETIPNKPIITGKTKGPDELDHLIPNPLSHAALTPGPASLGRLARGSAKLSTWKPLP